MHQICTFKMNNSDKYYHPKPVEEASFKQFLCPVLFGGTFGSRLLCMLETRQSITIFTVSNQLWVFFFPGLVIDFQGLKKKKSKPFVNINTCSCIENAEPPSTADWLMSFCGFGRKFLSCSFAKSLILTSLLNKQENVHVTHWGLSKCNVTFRNIY